MTDQCADAAAERTRHVENHAASMAWLAAEKSTDPAPAISRRRFPSEPRKSKRTILQWAATSPARACPEVQHKGHRPREALAKRTQKAKLYFFSLACHSGEAAARGGGRWPALLRPDLQTAPPERTQNVERNNKTMLSLPKDGIGLPPRHQPDRALL